MITHIKFSIYLIYISSPYQKNVMVRWHIIIHKLQGNNSFCTVIWMTGISERAREERRRRREGGQGERVQIYGARSKGGAQKDGGVTEIECWSKNGVRGINAEAKSETYDCPCARSADATGWLGSVAHLSLAYWNVYQTNVSKILFRSMSVFPNWDATDVASISLLTEMRDNLCFKAQQWRN